MVDSKRFCASRQKITRMGPSTPNGTVVDRIYRTATAVSTDSRVGSKNPRWRDNIRRVIQAGSAYSRSALTRGVVTGTITGSFHEDAQKTRVCTEVLSGVLFLDNGPPTPVTPSFPSLDVRARIDFLQKCRSARRRFQGGVFLGELREAINMIARPGAALRRGIGAYLADAKNVVRRYHYTDRGRILTKTWLEYSYGWRPLFRDIDSGMRALAATDHIVPDIIVGVASDEGGSNPVSRSTLASGGNTIGTALFREKTRGSVRYLGCVAWESTNRAQEWESPKWGLTLSDFVPTVWELIPYSFIVDYFSNVGQVIDASSFGVVSLRWGVRSQLLNSSIQMGRQSSSFYGLSPSAKPIYSTVNLSLSQLSSWSFSRTLITSVSVGLNDLRFRVPGVSDWRKWANLAALAIDKAY